MSFTTVNALVRTAGATVSKHAPEILLASGAVGFVATVVTASHATLKAEVILEEHNTKMRDIKTTRAISSDERYSESDEKKDILTLRTQTSIKMIKQYAIPLGIGALSLTCFFASYGIMRKRYVALSAAYVSLEESFRLYRQRVVEDKGEDADIYYLTGVKPKEITQTDPETGEKTKVKTIKDLNGIAHAASPYMIKFGKYREDGERNVQWQNDTHLNRCFVMGQLDYLNHLLFERSVRDKDGYVLKRGSVMLNELRELLGETTSTTGSVVGWRYSNGEKGCNGYIDETSVIESIERDPQTGDEIGCFYINPNVDGLIYDLLDKWEDEPWLPNTTPYGED